MGEQCALLGHIIVYFSAALVYSLHAQQTVPSTKKYTLLKSSVCFEVVALLE